MAEYVIMFGMEKRVSRRGSWQEMRRIGNRRQPKTDHPQVRGLGVRRPLKIIVLHIFIEGLDYSHDLLKWQSRELRVLEFTIISK